MPGNDSLPNLPEFRIGLIRAIAIRFADAWIAACVALWAVGGVAWNGRMILTHGADPRRAALLTAIALAWLWPTFWRQSVWVRLAGVAWRALESSRGRWVVLGTGCALAATVSVSQSLALRTPMYDVGIFHQILWALSEGRGFLSTISGAGDFLVDHLSLSLALLAPLYWITGASPLTLAVLHPALLFAGVAAWVWLAERLGAGREWGRTLAAATALFGLAFGSLWGNLHWGFHENAIAFAALSWALVLAISPPSATWAKGLTLTLFLIAAGSKEILLLDVALALSVWAALLRRPGRESKRGAAWFPVLLIGIACVLIVSFVLFERMPHPPDKNYFNRYYGYLGHGLGEFFSTLLSSPGTVVRNVGALELLRYAGTVLAPWLLLPLAAPWIAGRSTLWVLAILPSLASAALATYPPLRQPSFHYVLELWPALAVVTLVTLSRMRKPRRWAMAWAMLALVAWDHDPIGDLREYARGALEAAPLRRAFAAVPPLESVTADELTGTWLAGRPEVTRWPALGTWSGECPEWVVLPERAAEERMIAICGKKPYTRLRIGTWYLMKATPKTL